jgi:DNA-binding NarL/FixJ family response regulator
MMAAHRVPRLRKVLLVEDHKLVRESMMLLLDMRLPHHAWREADSLSTALRCLTHEPDIDLLLLDLNLTDSRGLATLTRLREAVPDVPVVVVSANDSPDDVFAAIDGGAAGYMSKTVSADDFVAGVRRVLDGGVLVPESVAPRRAPSDSFPVLTDRQSDVLRLLIEGKSNKLIARALELSDATVKTHLLAIYRKLEVASRTQAVLAAARWRMSL